jgi:hypothetical protein
VERRDTQIMDKWWLLTRIFGRIFRKTENERGILVAVFTYSIIFFKTNLDDMSIFEMFQTKIVPQTYPLSSQPQARVSVKKCKKCTNIIRYDNNNNNFMILVHVCKIIHFFTDERLLSSMIYAVDFYDWKNLLMLYSKSIIYLLYFTFCKITNGYKSHKWFCTAWTLYF